MCLHLQAENTYILTLDGDIDFKAESVNLLVDRMKKNKKVGAACGRIHPIGTGRLLQPYAFWPCNGGSKRTNPLRDLFCLGCQVPWCGTRSLNTLLVIGCRRQPSTCLAVCCAALAASRSSAARLSWMTTSCAPMQQSPPKLVTTFSMTKVLHAAAATVLYTARYCYNYIIQRCYCTTSWCFQIVGYMPSNIATTAVLNFYVA